MLADFWGSSATFGAYWLPYFLVFWVISLAAYRTLMAWVYRHTHSLMLGMLMHAFFTGGFFVLLPAMSVPDQMRWGLTFAACMVVTAAGVALAEKFGVASTRH
jgi:hypothetical protein